MLYPDYYPQSPPQFAVHLSNGIPPDVIEVYFAKVNLHIAAVQEAGIRLGVPEYQLRRHDLSKFHAEQFAPYAMHFHGGGAPKEFARAWLDHIHKEPHHWQHWLFADGFGIKDGDVVGGALPMPETYALEMIADWIGASVVYSGTENMADWLDKNLHKVRLHPRTEAYVDFNLIKLGYEAQVRAARFRQLPNGPGET